MENKDFIKVSSKIRKVIKKIIELAIDYKDITGREPGITGEVGEILVCDRLKLSLMKNQINPGFDAIKNKRRYQIKTRRIIGSRIRGKLGVFSKHKFDFAILVLLDEGYNIEKIYRMNYKVLSRIIERYPNRRIPTRIFIDNAKEV